MSIMSVATIYLAVAILCGHLVLLEWIEQATLTERALFKFYVTNKLASYKTERISSNVF